MVNFGKRLQHDVSCASAASRMFFLDYAALKKTLEAPDELVRDSTLLQKLETMEGLEGTPLPPKDSPTVRFLRMIDNELEKVNSYVMAKLHSLEVSFSQLFRHASSASVNSLETLETDALQAGTDLLELDKFVRTNLTGFRKIIKKFDKVHSERATVWLTARLAKESFCNLSLDQLIMVLSDIHSLLREQRAKLTASTTGESGDANDHTKALDRGQRRQGGRLSTTCSA